MKIFSQMDIDGNYFLLVDQGMASFADIDPALGVKKRAGGILLHGKRSTGKNKVQLHHIFQIILNLFPMLGGKFA